MAVAEQGSADGSSHDDHGVRHRRPASCICQLAAGSMLQLQSISPSTTQVRSRSSTLVMAAFAPSAQTHGVKCCGSIAATTAQMSVSKHSRHKISVQAQLMKLGLVYAVNRHPMLAG